jgi:fructose-1,6-bisphosphatase/inositol monophosphatase family enzyme
MSKKSDKAPTPDQLAKVLITAAKAGGAVLLNHFNKKRIIREKVDAGLVTQIDVASEKAIIKILKKNFPDFSILTEEEGSHVSQSA